MQSMRECDISLLYLLFQRFVLFLVAFLWHSTYQESESISHYETTQCCRANRMVVYTLICRACWIYCYASNSLINSSHIARSFHAIKSESMSMCNLLLHHRLIGFRTWIQQCSQWSLIRYLCASACDCRSALVSSVHNNAQLGMQCFLCLRQIYLIFSSVCVCMHVDLPLWCGWRCDIVITNHSPQPSAH